ncbi:hypothetical protein QE390_002472 [Siphonobacter sp. SORGH_AS 1065]|nr:hypothetical protein [Siphonobacter sp. SORGH_AS_1065]
MAGEDTSQGGSNKNRVWPGNENNLDSNKMAS